MIGQGVSSRSSHSWAAGRTTSAAKPCTQSRMSFWSWLSASEKLTSCAAAPEIASSAASVASVASEALADDWAVADIKCSWLRGWTNGRSRGDLVEEASEIPYRQKGLTAAV